MPFPAPAARPGAPRRSRVAAEQLRNSPIQDREPPRPGPRARRSGPRASSAMTKSAMPASGFEDARASPGLHASLAVNSLCRSDVAGEWPDDPGADHRGRSGNPGSPIDLSAGAARALGHDGGGPSACACAKSPRAQGHAGAPRGPARRRRVPIRRRSCSTRCASICERVGSSTRRSATPAHHAAMRRVSRPSVSARAAPPAARRHRAAAFYVQVAALSNAQERASACTEDKRVRKAGRRALSRAARPLSPQSGRRMLRAAGPHARVMGTRA
jgi:hypothetical protein